MAIYMVRAYKNQFDEFFNNNIVAVGWSDINFSAFEDIEKLIEEVVKQYNYLNKLTPSTKGRTLNQIRRFNPSLPLI